MRNPKSFLVFAFAALCALPACGSHPLNGNWSQQTADGAPGMSIEFDTNGDRVLVHTAPDKSGHHEHVEGTYSFDAMVKTVTVRAKLLGDGKPEAWSGTVDGAQMTLGAAEATLTFRRGGKAHGH
jgi:hypothetical protein